jgi:hypothetical protein
MSYPCDSEAWQHFDKSHPDFTKEMQNVRLSLCTNGFSPFGLLGKQYSSWPVILILYNLTLIKDSVLRVIIPGPKNPKHKANVYLQPLVDELIVV